MKISTWITIITAKSTACGGLVPGQKLNLPDVGSWALKVVWLLFLV